MTSGSRSSPGTAWHDSQLASDVCVIRDLRRTIVDDAIVRLTSHSRTRSPYDEVQPDAADRADHADRSASRTGLLTPGRERTLATPPGRYEPKRLASARSGFLRV
jgi:hypothetical protein